MIVCVIFFSLFQRRDGGWGLLAPFRVLGVMCGCIPNTVENWIPNSIPNTCGIRRRVLMNTTVGGFLVWHIKFLLENATKQPGALQAIMIKFLEICSFFSFPLVVLDRGDCVRGEGKWVWRVLSFVIWPALIFHFSPLITGLGRAVRLQPRLCDTGMCTVIGSGQQNKNLKSNYRATVKQA